tara:strand:- start:8 stop:484 length:477 start_codon:yes stop_codon:yes gene_type:complete
MTFIPENPKTYQGNQVIINSDRLVFNAKNDAILLYSDKAIGFSTKGNFHFDTDNNKDTKFIVNAPNIYLGIGNLNTGELPTEPAVLGNELEILLTEILDFLELFLLDAAYNLSGISTTPTNPTAMNPKNSTIVDQRMRQIQDIKNNIQSIMSQNTKLV